VNEILHSVPRVEAQPIINDYHYQEPIGMQLNTILEERRMRSDLIETFKIVNRKYDIIPELFF